MVKQHNCLVDITNKTQFSMSYMEEWYYNGRLADGFSWPKTINAGDHQKVLNYERDWSMVGCSGYVTYKMNNTNVTIAFSNPLLGVNTLGVGTGGMKVWDYMDNHRYQGFTEKLNSSDGVILSCHCECTGGNTNTCSVYLAEMN